MIRRRIAVRSPNHLGDAVMALPAIRSLAEVGPVTVYAPRGLHPLFGGLPVRLPSRMRADVAVLFAPSFRSAWQARGCTTIIGTPTDHRSRLLHVRVPERTGRADTYGDLSRAAGGLPVGPPVVRVRGRARRVPADHTALFPLVGGGRNRRWDGFRVLADRLEEPVVFYGGPGESERIRAIAGPHRVCLDTDLRELAATLQFARRVVANDSGPAHFARAVGRPTLVIHTSTTPARTGPAEAHSVHGPALACRPCMANRCCRRDAERLGCLAVSVEQVLGALRRLG